MTFLFWSKKTNSGSLLSAVRCVTFTSLRYLCMACCRELTIVLLPFTANIDALRGCDVKCVSQTLSMSSETALIELQKRKHQLYLQSSLSHVYVSNHITIKFHNLIRLVYIYGSTLQLNRFVCVPYRLQKTVRSCYKAARPASLQ